MGVLGHARYDGCLQAERDLIMLLGFFIHITWLEKKEGLYINDRTWIDCEQGKKRAASIGLFIKIQSQSSPEGE